MKTSWSQPYLARRHRRMWEWCNAKRREFEAKTRVSWTYDTGHDRVRFAPRFVAGKARNARPADVRVVEAILDERQASNYFGGILFLDLADQTGLPLPRVMATLEVLWRRRRVQFTVNRMGLAVAVQNRR